MSYNTEDLIRKYFSQIKISKEYDRDCETFLIEIPMLSNPIIISRDSKYMTIISYKYYTDKLKKRQKKICDEYEIQYRWSEFSYKCSPEDIDFHIDRFVRAVIVLENS